jgi:transcription elongation factor Elf1
MRFVYLEAGSGVRGEVEVKPYMTIVDAYGAWTDLVYSGKLGIMGLTTVYAPF